MTIIAFISQKGGVGKSTLSQALATEASKQKLKTLTDKIKQNLHEWKIKEVVIFKGYFGGKGEVKELALVHQEANLRSYNWQGYLEVDPRMIYFKKDHQPEEWVQIEQYYSNKVGGSSAVQSNNPQSPTNSEIIQEVKNDPQNWRLGEVITEYNVLGGAKKKEIALIHNSAQVGYDGAVLDDNQSVYLAAKFNQGEITEINRVLNVSQSPAGSSSHYHYQQNPSGSLTNTSNQDNSSDKGGIIAIIGVVSASLVASGVVIKKRLSRKIKR